MIKKILQSLLIAALLFGASAYGQEGSSPDLKKESKLEKKEQRKKEREEKKRKREEERKLKKEQAKLKKESKKEKKHKSKLEKTTEKKEKKGLSCSRKKAEPETKQEIVKSKKQVRAEERTAKKAKRDAQRAEKKAANCKTKKCKSKSKAVKAQEKKATGGWWDKFWTKEEKKAAKKEKLAMVAAQKEEAKVVKKELKKEKAYTIAAKEKAAAESRKLEKARLAENKKIATEKKTKLMAAWKEIRGQELAEDYKEGMYADLYKIPAWPFHMMFADYRKDLFQVTAKYDYQTDAFSSSGSSHDLSKLYFGEKSFNFSDILLALKLNTNGKLLANQKNNMTWNALIGKDHADKAITAFYNKDLIFNARSEEYSFSFDYLRYLWGKDVCFGFGLPVGYQAHKLKFISSAGPSTFDEESTEYLKSPMSQTNIAEMLNYVMQPKNLTYLPKTSVAGIGDLSTFLTMQINCRYFEKWLAGFKVLWPTAKKADTKKLWAPTLGNGGFTELTAYTSMLFNRQESYFNPHMLLQATYKLRGHVDRRVPKYVSGTVAKEATKTSDNRKLEDIMAHGELVKGLSSDTSSIFTNYLDSMIPAFADEVKSIRIRPGAEFNFRIGNIFEKLIFRRAFLDIFYDFRARLKDTIGGDLPRDLWNVDILKDRTNQIEHKIGLLYDYQFDFQSRLRLGFNWSFAGINVPSTVEGSLAMAVEF